MQKAGFQYDLFVSHAQPDGAWVHGYLVPALGLPAERVITPDVFRPGASTVSELDRAVTGSQYTLLILTPDYLADEWAALSEQLASHAATADGQNRLVPLTLKNCDLPLRIDFRVRLDCRAEQNWEHEIARLRELLSRPEPVQERISCPYPGIVAFGAKNALHFYGRQDETDHIIRRLHQGQRFLFIIGPSGAGKSSLVRAGLLPRLTDSTLFPPGYWLIREMDAIAGPTEKLTQIIGDVARPSTSIDALLAGNPRAQRLLLFIDRYEALFSQATSVEQRRFLSAIEDLRQVVNCALLIAMRANFYEDFMNASLSPLHANERFEIVPLRGEALRKAIHKPAADVGVHLEPILVERLLSDAANEPGVLPLMQETMTLLWEKLARRFLSFSAYEQMGQDRRSGLAVAIATKADAALSDLSSPQQAIARRVISAVW